MYLICTFYARYHNLLTSCALYYCNLSYPSISYAQNLLTSYAQIHSRRLHNEEMDEDIDKLINHYNKFEKARVLRFFNLRDKLRRQRQRRQKRKERRLALLKFRDPKSSHIRTGTKNEIDHDNLAEQTLRHQASLINLADESIEEGYTAFRVFDRHERGHVEQTNNELFTPSKIRIEILNPNPNNRYSVTIEATNKYTGTAKLINRQSAVGSLIYAWVPIFPGAYTIHVHEIDQEFSHTTPLVTPGEYPIYINEGSAAQGIGVSMLQDRIENMPPCQSIQNNVQLFSNWDGDWLGPDFQLPDSVRTGWSFLPSSETMGCKLETFNYDEIQSIPEKKKILILGRSVERGVFLSLVDMMLDRQEGKYINKSTIGKCWGRASVKKNNLEVMYQDFRVTEFEDPTEEAFIECHNEKLVKEPGSSFIHNASAVWQEIFTQDASEWPNVIFMVTGLGAARFRFEHHVIPFVQSLPPTWDGTLFLGDMEFSGRTAGLMSSSRYEYYLQEISNLVTSLNDNRVRWIDGPGVSKEQRMYSQKGPDFVGRSQHFHHSCMEIDEEDPTKAMAVCSNVTEMVGNLLLGHALGPKDQFLQHAEQVKNNFHDFTPNKSPSQLTWCHACPKCMIPMHLTPYPNMECVEGPLTAKEDYDCSALRFDGVSKDIVQGMCPADCLEQPFSDSFGSETDMVYVRQCPLNQ